MCINSDVETARKYLDRVRSLDPQTAGIQTSIRALAARRAEIRYQTLLSTGFSAMDEGDYEGADRAFNEVLRMRPGDTMANAGLQQTATNRTLRRIDELRSQAESAEADGDLKRALAFYTSALNIDRTLQFASDGKQRVRKRVGIISTIDRWLNEPGVLSADEEFNKAADLLTKARAEIGAGEIYDAAVAEFAKLLQIAGSPVPLVLVSDNSTQVTIYKVGPLGSFDRRELSLRPGYYTIVGSRNGCRDVRKVIMLIPDMEPIAIRCEERI